MSRLFLFLFSFRFEAKLPEIFKDVHEAYEQIDARLKAEQFKVWFHTDWADVHFWFTDVSGSSWYCHLCEPL